MIKPDDITDQACLQMGRSMLAFGLKYSMNLLSEQVAVLERQLAALEPVPTPTNGNGAIRPAMQRTMALIEEAASEAPPTVRDMRSDKNVKKVHGSRMKEYWAQFTPEGRKKEMKRRARLARRRREAGL
jgi:hypothetical protein